eukprot:CAMPEP_0202902368 /NCGR_PEP_ID=MMETSP1392-20130828/16812_1 /ASSEMBLY_ACC=CAM_ASM_000868 /TAXON_ID=225041 /ORGANISM="Chlamydomonas chlamydogama, Strain SAG 11-48b" /LENGTH=373 /DNA_ID=CAMNT_0049589121 /DNA_START=264 /DNA_END=1385 /DNA_ORIENTATION=+
MLEPTLKIDVGGDARKRKDQHVTSKGLGLGQESRRLALGDITHAAPAMKVFENKTGKVLAFTSKVAQPQIHEQLQQQQFTDPSLIDGAQHAEKRRRDWTDVDQLNKDDPQACGAYAAAIFQHVRETELLRRPNPNYLEQYQPDVNSKMRAILVDWLVEVAEEYKLCADTLYLTVNYIDRFLSTHIVQRSQLQLVGVACMWLAAKYEEIYPPNVADFCYITDNTYTKEQMIQMEELILKKLGYELTVPTAKMFLRRMLQVCNPDEHLHFLSNYLTEITLLDHNMMKHLPSEIAAAAVFLANLILKRQPWDGNLTHYSTYTLVDLNKCVHALAALHQAVSNNPQLVAIRDKYGHPRFQAVSRLQPLTSIPTHIFS